MSASSLLDALRTRCGRDWPTMRTARSEAEVKKAELSAILKAGDLVPIDTSFVVFGSLARGEWTGGSDLDWTLLADGPVAVSHPTVVREIGARIEGTGKKPGPTGTFGGLAFSHNLVHFIGGEDDTNKNITRRILLLLESASLDEGDVRHRVLRALLSRYVGEDLLYRTPGEFKVPRFLLNDYVRYWRTMAVDSAQKRRDRVEGWALRNIKLRLSRKLLFVTGLWACISCHLRPSEEMEQSREKNDRDGLASDVTEFFLGFSQRPSLEVLADAFVAFEAWEAARTAFDAYETFLAILNNQSERDHLKNLTVEQAGDDAVFARGKSAAAAFQAGLEKLFFETNSTLTRAVQAYGVF